MSFKVLHIGLEHYLNKTEHLNITIMHDEQELAKVKVYSSPFILEEKEREIKTLYIILYISYPRWHFLFTFIFVLIFSHNY